jgi:carbonic anhydrase
MHRRKFLLASSAIGAGLATSRSGLAEESGDHQRSLTAEQAIEDLMAGNNRFVTGKSQHPRMTEDWLKRLTKGQRPIVTILACSDSRVPVELLFDQGFGDLFVIRVAGNVITRAVLGTMQYAQHHLKTPLFVVLGHEGCGAVTAALLPKAERDKEPKGVQQLLERIQGGIKSIAPKANGQGNLRAAVEANVLWSAKQIIDVAPKVEGFSPRETDMLVAAVYEMSTGRVRILEKYSAADVEKRRE